MESYLATALQSMRCSVTIADRIFRSVTVAFWLPYVRWPDENGAVAFQIALNVFFARNALNQFAIAFERIE